MRALFALLLLPAGADATELMQPAALQAQVEAFAGGPAMVDPRLLLPACPRLEMAFAPGGNSVMVRCAMPEWRVFVPVGSVGSAGDMDTGGGAPAIRRGDRVMVEIAGAGFVVGMDAVAEADARDGRRHLRADNLARRRNRGCDGQCRLWRADA